MTVLRADTITKGGDLLDVAVTLDADTLTVEVTPRDPAVHVAIWQARDVIDTVIERLTA